MILPAGIQKRYGLGQDREFPEYDYCYCSECRSSFKEKEGIDPLDIQDEQTAQEWREFRYHNITSLVNELSGFVRSSGKKLSAAVFATPELSRKYVRQDWPVWNLDAAMPMIYQEHYGGKLPWIKKATKEGVAEVGGKYPIYSGLQMGHVRPDEIATAVDYALEAGAEGVSIFSFGGAAKHWETIKSKLAS